MRAQAEPVGTQGEVSAERGRHGSGVGEHKKRIFSDTVWVALIGSIGVIVAAVITAWPNIFGADDEKVATVQSSALGSIEKVTTNSDDTEVTIAGTAAPDVESVLVTIGPRNSDGQVWAETADVYAGEWRMVVSTKPELTRPYEIKAYYKQRSVELTSSHRVLASSLEDPPPTPAPAPPGQILECVVVHGDSCLQGQPGWGSPSIYQSQQ